MFMPITLASMLSTLVMGYVGISFFLNDPTPLEPIKQYYSAMGDSGAEITAKLITLIPIAFALNGLFYWSLVLFGCYSWIKDIHQHRRASEIARTGSNRNQFKR
ncbi:hypothetical protein AAFT98_003114 [Vibrio parahaemolyticus]